MAYHQRNLFRIANKPDILKPKDSATKQAKVARAKGKAQGIAADSFAFRAAGQYLQNILINRVTSSKDNTGAALKPVTPDYAKRRAIKYNMPDDTAIVARASRQLLESLRNTIQLSKV
jgi:hypothetical protein